jgi:hypothetical protein
MPLKSIKNSSQKQKDLAQYQISKSGIQIVKKGKSGKVKQGYSQTGTVLGDKGIMTTLDSGANRLIQINTKKPQKQSNILRYDKMNNCYSDPLTAGTLKSAGNNPNLIQLNQKETITQKQQSQPQMELFNSLEKSTLLLLDSLAKTSQLLASGLALKAQEVVSSLKQQKLSMFVNPVILSLKTSKVFSQVTTGNVLRRACKRLPTLGMMVNGNYLILGGGSPKIESGYTLSDILEENVDQKYFLSEKMVKNLKIYNDRQVENNRGFSAKFRNPETEIMDALRVGGGQKDDLIKLE